MSDAKSLVKEYLQGSAQTLQLATVQNGKPWIASVYFVADEDMNIYWLSWPERRHSQYLMGQPDVAAAIVIKTNKPVIGVQLEGKASEELNATVIRKIMKLYVAKYNTGTRFYEAFKAGENHHHMYKLEPSDVSLFDEVNFPSASPIKV